MQKIGVNILKLQ